MLRTPESRNLMPSSYFPIEIRVEKKPREILSCKNPEIKYQL